ncbi:MAG: rhodanese-like domain-containing protein [Planctomycetes bacterium]|nr:rhodanese-like domain-containing protein [Planctomycetota bacterium]
MLDVRTPEEHAAHRLPDATLVPVQELQQRVGELDADTEWLVCCAHGRRSVFACEFLVQMGFAKITNLRGGLANWAARGLPLER